MKTLEKFCYSQLLKEYWNDKELLKKDVKKSLSLYKNCSFPNHPIAKERISYYESMLKCANN